MMQIAVSTEDLTKIRFAISPMMITVLAMRALLHLNPTTHPMRDWLEMAQSRIEINDLSAFQKFHPTGNYVMDFMLPLPDHAQVKFEDELQQVANTPITQIEEEIAYLHQQGMITTPYSDVSALREQAVDEIAHFWTVVMQPYWQRIRTILEGDIMHHSRQLVLGGTVSLFHGIDTSMTFETSDVLSIATRATPPKPFDPQGHGLVLIPHLVSSCDVLVQTIPDRPVVITYRAYGAGLWNQATRPTDSNAMTVLFGDNRAHLLAELAQPTSTKDLAQKLAVTPGAISQQLSQLKEADLIASNRAGRSVYYYLNNRGVQLLELLG
ncbi:MAG: metalloregulator ArsR/SmtB family transcription factor [Chloroflexota bacterium]